MNEDMHSMNSAVISSMFDGLSNLQKQGQDGYNATMNAFNATSNMLNQNEPRRTDGFYSNAPMMQSYGGYGQNAGGMTQPPSYGYGYTENQYPYGNNISMSQQGQIQAYYGFYNPAYGK